MEELKVLRNLNIDIPADEIKRYLKFRPGKSIDTGATLRLIKEAAGAAKLLIEPVALYRTFQSEVREDNVKIREAFTVASSSLAERFFRSSRVTILAVTLGAVICERIDRLEEEEKITEALTLDAAASAAVEALADSVQLMLGQQASKEGFALTKRYSPGYGDLPLAYQNNIIDILDGRKYNISVSDSLILLPRKTVTAFIAWREKQID